MFCCGCFQTFCVFVVVIQLVCGVFRWIYANVLGPQFGTPINFRSYGKWALVTGATDGIGKEYARSLAKRGMNIILVSRTPSKLETVAKEIKDEFRVETAVIDVDFTSGPEIYDKIKDKVKGKEIGVLVNNVGMAVPVPDFFLNFPNREKLIKDMVNCNVLSIPMMCSIILPQMVQRKRGVIINIASGAAVTLAVNVGPYGGSKAFADKFSTDLAAEYEKDGIIVQSILPGLVSTNMSKMFVAGHESASMASSAEQYVESAIKTVGFATHTTGYWMHSAQLLVACLMNFLMPSVTRKLVLKFTKVSRDAAIKNGDYVSASDF